MFFKVLRNSEAYKFVEVYGRIVRKHILSVAFKSKVLIKVEPKPRGCQKLPCFSPFTFFLTS